MFYRYLIPIEQEKIKFKKIMKTDSELFEEACKTTQVIAREFFNYPKTKGFGKYFVKLANELSKGKSFRKCKCKILEKDTYTLDPKRNPFFPFHGILNDINDYLEEYNNGELDKDEFEHFFPIFPKYAILSIARDELLNVVYGAWSGSLTMVFDVIDLEGVGFFDYDDTTDTMGAINFKRIFNEKSFISRAKTENRKTLRNIENNLKRKSEWVDLSLSYKKIKQDQIAFTLNFSFGILGQE